MDEFKRHTRSLRDQLDSEEPSPEVWKRISNDIAPRKKSLVSSVAWPVAAAAAVLLFVFIFITKKEPARVNAPEMAVKKNVSTAPAPSLEARPVPPTQGIDSAANATESLVKVKPKLKVSPKASEPRALLQSFERNYYQLVNLQLQSIRSTPVYGESTGYFDDFSISLRQLESDESNIKQLIKTQGLSDALLERLIAVYQSKLDLLKSLQRQVARMNSRVQENMLSADSVSSFYIKI